MSAGITTLVVLASLFALGVAFLVGAAAATAWQRPKLSVIGQAGIDQEMQRAFALAMEMVSAAVRGHVSRVVRVENRLNDCRLGGEHCCDGVLLEAVIELRAAVVQLQHDMEGADPRAAIAGPLVPHTEHLASGSAGNACADETQPAQSEEARMERMPAKSLSSAPTRKQDSKSASKKAAGNATPLPVPDPTNVVDFVQGGGPDGNRSPFPYVQRIAPTTQGARPDPSDFKEVRLRSISTAGFSYYSAERPPSLDLAIGLGVGSGVSYFMARVAHVEDATLDGFPCLLIDCHFTSRIKA